MSQGDPSVARTALRTYDYLVLARERLFAWVRPLSPEQHVREFAIGRGTLTRTLTHIVASEWYYVQRILRQSVPPYEQWPLREEAPPALPALETAWREQAGVTRAALGAVRDWCAEFEYPVTDDDGEALIVTASTADVFTQLVLHEVHHRAQAMNMLRQMGIAAEDLDFNALMYKRRRADDGAAAT